MFFQHKISPLCSPRQSFLAEQQCSDSSTKSFRYNLECIFKQNKVVHITYTETDSRGLISKGGMITANQICCSYRNLTIVPGHIWTFVYLYRPTQSKSLVTTPCRRELVTIHGSLLIWPQGHNMSLTNKTKAALFNYFTPPLSPPTLDCSCPWLCLQSLLCLKELLS